MNDAFSLKIWLYRLLFIFLGLVTVFASLLPTEINFNAWGAPDVVLVTALAWTVRRPYYAPIVMVGLIIFFQDLLLQRPPGLLPALTMIPLMRLQKQAYRPEDATFWEEWINAAMIIILIAIGLRFVMNITFLDLPRFSVHLSSVVFSFLLYPVVAVVSERILGITPLSLNEIEIARQEGRL